MTHKLKIHPQHYARVKDGSKTFEIRVNDRQFQMGDLVVLEEWDPTPTQKHDTSRRSLTTMLNGGYEEKGYTESPPLRFRIGCVYPVDEKRVVFSLMKLGGM